MVIKLSRSDLAFMVFSLISTIFILTRYCMESVYDGPGDPVGGMIIVFFSLISGAYLAIYTLVAFAELVILIIKKSIDSVFALFLYASWFFYLFFLLPKLKFESEWMFNNKGLVILVLRLLLLLIFVFWRNRKIFYLKLLLCAAVILIETLTENFDLLGFDAMISILFIVWHEAIFTKRPIVLTFW